MRRVRHQLLATALVALAAAPAAAATIAAAGIQNSATSNPQQVAGNGGETVSVAENGVEVRAQTDYGVNRVYNAAGVGHDGEGFASSVWAQTFTANGSGIVSIAMNFTIDGSIAYGPGGAGRETNYFLSALPGAWNLSAADGYDDILAVRAGTSSTVLSGRTLNFTGMSSVPVEFESESRASYFGEAADGSTHDRTTVRIGDNFTITNYFIDATNGGTTTLVVQEFTPTHYRETRNGQAGPLIPLSASPALLAGYQGLKASWALGTASLCPINGAGGDDGGCAAGTYPPTTLTLAFDIAGGSQFSIISALMSEDAEDGLVDFFNTVRLSSITATGGTLSANNGAFVSNGDGSYGFTTAAVPGAVPEPTTWAMMIGGFGLVGGALRSARRGRPATA